MQKIKKKGVEFISSLLKGLKEFDSVLESLGPYGLNTMIGKGPKVSIVNDGKIISENTSSDDEIANLTIKAVRQACRTTSLRVKDATTRTVTLITAIVTSILKEESDSLAGKTINVNEVRNEILETCERAVALLNKKAKKIKTKEDIYNVAFTASENKLVSEQIATAFDKIGKGGTISVEDNTERKIEVEISDGYELENGFGQYSFMANKPDLTCEIDNPYVLVTDRVIQTASEIKHISEELGISHGTREMVIVAKTFGDSAMGSFLSNREQGIFHVLGIKAPIFRQGYTLKDLATALGAKFISERTHTSFKDIGVSDLGRSEKVIANSDIASFIKPEANVQDTVIELKTSHDLEKSEHERTKILERIAKLEGKIARIKVGTNSDNELEYLKVKVNNAVNSTRLAMEEGIIQGGGITLQEVDEELGENILSPALQSINKQIQENAGKTFTISKDVVDPVITERVALETACSLAGMIITTGTGIDKKNPTDFAEELKALINKND